MDQLKNLASKIGTGQQQQQQQPQQQQGVGGQQEDYVDKGLDAVEKKLGMQQNRDTNERITDGAREMFEKATGKHVPDKVSN